jgi:YHS domain-containing protein
MRYFINVVFVFLSFTTFAQELSGKAFTTKNGAIDGYDAVAYFTDAKPVKGQKQFALKYKDALWYFASAEHQALFKANPQKYAPQFGGFCAYGVSRGYKVKIEPEAWEIFEGKLYLNYDLDIQQKWKKDKAGYVKKANANWIEIKDE